jgi:hypothetical protein
MKVRTIQKVVSKTTLSEKNSDFAYWQTKNYAERLTALEEICQEYNNWKYTDAEQRFQRVYRVVKLKEKNIL